MSGGTHSFAKNSEAGVTLLEMLIVLVVIAIGAGAVALGMGAVTRAPTVEGEARRLAARLQSAGDSAMLGDRMIALTVEGDGYGFVELVDGKQVVRKDEALKFHQIPAGMTMTLAVAPPVVLGVDGAGDPVVATMESGKQRWLVIYDGMTARVTPAPAEKPAGAEEAS